MKKRAITYLSILVSALILWSGSEVIAQSYKLTVEQQGEGSGAVSDHLGHAYGEGPGLLFDRGTKIILKVEADPDSFFKGWEGGECSGTKTCTVMMDSDISVTAVFENTDNAPVMSISPQPFLSFGKVKINTSKTKTWTISNKGKADLAGAFSLDLGEVEQFIMSGAAFTIKPKKKQSFKATFMPLKVGIHNAGVDVTSNDPNNPEELFVVQGEGVCKGEKIDTDYEFDVSLMGSNASLNLAYSGTGTVPLKIHRCPHDEDTCQVIGRGNINVTFNTTSGSPCSTTATFVQDVAISPSLATSTCDTLVFHADLPFLLWTTQHVVRTRTAAQHAER